MPRRDSYGSGLGQLLPELTEEDIVFDDDEPTPVLRRLRCPACGGLGWSQYLHISGSLDKGGKWMLWRCDLCEWAGEVAPVVAVEWRAMQRGTGKQ